MDVAFWYRSGASPSVECSFSSCVLLYEQGVGDFYRVELGVLSFVAPSHEQLVINTTRRTDGPRATRPNDPGFPAQGRSWVPSPRTHPV